MEGKVLKKVEGYDVGQCVEVKWEGEGIVKIESDIKEG